MIMLGILDVINVLLMSVHGQSEISDFRPFNEIISEIIRGFKFGSINIHCLFKHID